MGRAIVRQPNGLLAAFSTNTDTFIAYDMTEEEYIDLRVREAKKQAKAEAKQIIKDVRKHGTSAFRRPFYYDFEKCMEMHVRHDGEPFEMRKT